MKEWCGVNTFGSRLELVQTPMKTVMCL